MASILFQLHDSLQGACHIATSNKINKPVLGGALLLIDADGHGGTVSGEQLAASGEHQQQVDGEQGLGSRSITSIESGTRSHVSI